MKPEEEIEEFTIIIHEDMTYEELKCAKIKYYENLNIFGICILKLFNPKTGEYETLKEFE